MKYKIGRATVDLNLLAALNALLEEGSVTKAAQRMNLSAPAMSRILSQIREAFDDPMLVRSGRHLVTTPRAEQLRSPVQQWVAQAETLFQAPNALDMSTYKGGFTLYANDVFLSVYAPALIQKVQHEAPHVVLKCLPEQREEHALSQLWRCSVVYWFNSNARPRCKSTNAFSYPLCGGGGGYPSYF